MYDSLCSSYLIFYDFACSTQKELGRLIKLLDPYCSEIYYA